MLPIDQIISHITGTNLEKQQVVQTPDSQAGAENTSAEASRRSSTSTQNTDTLTPTNIPSDPTDNQENVVSATSAETVVEVHHNIQDDPNNLILKSYHSSMTHAPAQTQDVMMNASHANEVSKESQELQDVVDVKECGETVKETSVSDVTAEISSLTVPTPVRKVSRFLVSPVVEQKNIATEEESSATTEGTDRTNATTSQLVSQSVGSAAESVAKGEDHVEASVVEAQTVAMHEKAGNIETVVQGMQGVQYTMEQTDSGQQQVLQQPIGLQNIIQMQTLQQVTGHMQQTTTIGQSKQHTIIVQGATITSQQTSHQMPQTSMQNFVPMNTQKELQPQSLHTTNGITQQVQYQNQPMVQPNLVMQQQQQQQQIPIQQSVMQPHIQTEQHQHQGQMQAQRPPAVQQFVPQQVQPPPTQQYVMLSGPMQPMQTANLDERSRRVPSLSTNVSIDSQIPEVSSIVEEKRQATLTAASTPMTHMQHVQVIAQQDIPSAMPLAQNTVETAQQLQTAHPNVQHVPGTLAPSVPQVPLTVHPVVAADISTPKVITKTKEVSSTLPDLAQNLANILSNPKSKSATPHPLTSHEQLTAVPNVASSTLVEHKSVQSEQYFQPIQPEASQLQIQPSIHNYQGQGVHQVYQGQQNFQQAFQCQQLLHQGQTQTMPQSVPLTIPQQIDAQSQMVQSTLQSVSGQLSAQGKWIISNQTPLQQPIRHVQPTQLQPLQNQPQQLQQIPMQSQVQPQTMQDQQHSESSIVSDHLHLKLPEQHSMKPLEAEISESSNLNWYAHVYYTHVYYTHTNTRARVYTGCLRNFRQNEV